MGEANTEAGQAAACHMRKRRTALKDGRYLIYYTFGDEGGAEGGSGQRPEPEPEAEASEERHV